MANASVAMGLESVVESWVSTMEHHNRTDWSRSAWWPSTAPRRSSVTLWWRRHWVRRSSDIWSYAVSEAVDRIVKLPASVPFMAE